MTNRIDHTACNHPKTTAARTACRKAITAGTATAPVIDYVARDMNKTRTAHAIRTRMDREQEILNARETASDRATWYDMDH